MKFISNRKIGTRIAGGFLMVAALTAFAGIMGIVNINKMRKAIYRISYVESPTIDAAMEMKVSLMKIRNTMDKYKSATSVLAISDESALKEIELNYNKCVEDFDEFAYAILYGGETPAGTVIATDNAELRILVEQSDKLYNDNFQVATQSLMIAGKKLLAQEKYTNQAMLIMEEAALEIHSVAGEAEEIVKELIRVNKKNNGNLNDIFIYDVPLLDLVMEIIITISNSRIVIEEIAQATTEIEIIDFEMKFNRTLQEFNVWVDALLNGGETPMGKVFAATNEKLLSKVKKLDQNHVEFQSAANDFIKGHLTLVQLSKETDEAMELLDKYGEKIDVLLDKVERVSGDEMISAVLSADDAGTRANITLILITIVSVLFGIGIGIVISRGITQPIYKLVEALRRLGKKDLTATTNIDSNDEMGVMAKSFNTAVKNVSDMLIQVKQSAEQIGNATEQISSSSEEMATGSEEQQSQLNEVATSMEEMSAMILQTSNSAGETQENTDQANQVAEGGKQSVNESIVGINRVADIVNSAAEQIQSLETRSQEIGQVIQVIDDIADQTNLLALNANIEAARAGDAGRGFAVVADEVRKLAERTVSATAEIGGKIKQIQNDIGSSVASMHAIAEKTESTQGLASESGKALEDIVSSITNVNKAVSQIANAAAEQNSGTEQISKNVESVSTVARQAASGAQELAASAEQLNGEVRGLNELVGQFKVD